MALTNLTIRRPKQTDAAVIGLIDAEGLATGHATFRDKPHEWSGFSASFLTGHGFGRRLLGNLISTSEGAGYWTLVAQIFGENEASLSPHAASGFRTIGLRQKLGKMSYGSFKGRWRDVIMLERRSHAIE